MKLSIVIPVYNEEKTVLHLLERVEAALASPPKGISSYEIVIVNDGSHDKTGEVLEDHTRERPEITLHQHSVNQGKGAAITTAFSKTTGDIVLIQDADLEYDPSDYPTILAPLVSGVADAVYGSRFKGETSRVLYFWHYVGNFMLTLLSNMFTNLNLSDMETCYKAFKGKLIREMILESKRFGIEPEMTAKLAKLPEVRIYEVPISYYGRTYAEGKKIGWKDGFSALWCIVKYNLLTAPAESYKKNINEIL